ncbi:MAG: NitT/TauT family transport system permease protein [Frankiales bacterium]|jgi:NitT/TauT family transport system permease protein|nr:NitT/TauT family transport system permease protein [Frankiales bacterium]
MSILDSRRGGGNGNNDDLASLEAGLDALETRHDTAASRGRRILSASWPPVLAIALLLLVWELTYRSGVKPPYALPSPADVGLVLRDQLRDGTLLDAMATSLTRGGLGFLAALAIGTPLGILIARVRPVRRGIGPLVSGLQSLPSVAWVPAAIIFFGIGDTAIYAVVLLGATPSIANGMVSGIDQIPPLYQRVGQVLGARGLSSARHVLLPAALPGYVGGLRQGWAFSWRSLMAAELIVNSPELGQGLGQLLDAGRSLNDMSLVFAGILGILVVGIAVELCVFAPLERTVLRRRGLLVARS